MKKGLLLINLGTPDAPYPPAIRRYLAEFLRDKRVIDLPALLRYPLVYGAILPFRPKQTAKAYQEIWTDQGSPLEIHSFNLQRKLQEGLGEQWLVSLGMRYGKPSLQKGLDQLKHCEQLTILPLYPQYSSAATGSALEKILSLIASKTTIPSLNLIRDFYQDPGFIRSQATLIKPELDKNDYLLFSYHGVPERHLKKSGCSKVCTVACAPISEANQACYRAQCYSTTLALAQELQLSETKYSMSFQSRLGKTPWIKPYTDEVLAELIDKGIRRLAIACPSFVADCLETLEEIGIRAKQQWLALGGESLSLIPCVNDTDLWVEALCRLVTGKS
ncbi:Ferrochelatase [Legionella massiliensis]|uniref:Ferrochelatase n=1 Tax=Legionella massiliensis TaxID=1034943 RepID=A0A078KSU9_9GAMM|nr:ferrochelatase [Legionella massiliensis]CDZ77500.1 Ferrochelatase [Legionella massiliensis]CEE13238.1 Ferrochelatase [Legionella massiliensis]